MKAKATSEVSIDQKGVPREGVLVAHGGSSHRQDLWPLPRGRVANAMSSSCDLGEGGRVFFSGGLCLARLDASSRAQRCCLCSHPWAGTACPRCAPALHAVHWFPHLTLYRTWSKAPPVYHPLPRVKSFPKEAASRTCDIAAAVAADLSRTSQDRRVRATPRASPAAMLSLNIDVDVAAGAPLRGEVPSLGCLWALQKVNEWDRGLHVKKWRSSPSQKLLLNQIVKVIN